MKTQLKRFAACALFALPMTVMAGADEPIVAAPVYDEIINQISLREGEILHDQGVLFYDCNELEIWAQGHVPGAYFFNVGDWKKLLPEDKDTPIVFYCLNRLCTNSETAAREAMKLGYTQVRQMYEGIEGWRISGRRVELP